MSGAEYDYKERPKGLARDDFWRQVRRTQNGEPISEEDVAQIVDEIVRGLRLRPDDVVLDLACGNGALSARLLPHCRQLVGVDHSAYLIGVANEFFAQPDVATFEVGEVDSYVMHESDPKRFSRVLCYGSFAYFSSVAAETMLSGLSKRFENVERVFIGNLPDRDRAHVFFPAGEDYEPGLSDHNSTIGIWRTTAEITELAQRCGWSAEVSRMSEGVFNARYRYDVSLERSRP